MNNNMTKNKNLMSIELDKISESIEELKRIGCTILIISHNLHHVFSISDRITVLRSGKKVGTWLKKDTNADEIVSAITGANILNAN